MSFQEEKKKILKIPYPVAILNKYYPHETRKGFHKTKRGNPVITKADLYHFNIIFLIPR